MCYIIQVSLISKGEMWAKWPLTEMATYLPSIATKLL